MKYLDEIKSIISVISPETFEKICVKLLRKLCNKQFKIKGTRYYKDGGKDIEGLVEGIPYKVWAECKKHSNSIGLQEIGKNVIIVLSEGVNELYFFSYSRITESAKHYILDVADKRFSVSFFDDKELFHAFTLLDEFKTYKRNIETLPILSVRTILSEYNIPNKFNKKIDLTLTMGNSFFIYIYLKNNTNSFITDIKIDIEKSIYFQIYIREKDKCFTLNPYCDWEIKLKVSTLNNKDEINLPKIFIHYVINNEQRQEFINLGKINPKKLLYFPIVGENIKSFIKDVNENILNCQFPHNHVLKITGGSGTGKSRLIKEIIDIAENNDFVIKLFDCNHKNDLTIIKEILCSLMSIPYREGNINFSAETIKKMLRLYKQNEDFADIIYNFVFKNEFSSETIYFIQEVIIYFITNPMFDNKYLFAIDNLQNINYVVLDILKNIIINLQYIDSNIIFIFSTNTEYILDKEYVKHFNDLLETYEEPFLKNIGITELQKEDTLLLYLHAIPELNSYEKYLDTLIKKSGNRPYDIIMLIKFLQDKQIIQFHGSESWFIKDIELFNTFLKSVPPKSEKLIEKRLAIQKEKYFWEDFKNIIKSLIIFRGKVYIDFLNYIDIDDEKIKEITDTLFFKYDDQLPILNFYHDNLERYFKNKKEYIHDKKISEKALEWINKNDKDQIDIHNSEIIKFYCYINMLMFKEAYKIGIIAIKDYFKRYNFIEVIEIATTILNTTVFEISSKDKFEILCLLADSYRGRVNHEKGAIYFNKARNFLKEHFVEIDLTLNEINKFIKNAVNANINSNHPQEALKIIEDFKIYGFYNDFYKFIYYDRLGVINLFLDNLDQSKKSLLRALEISKKNREWESILYSDLAYFYYRGKEDIIQTRKYFNLAFENQNFQTENTNRVVELLGQKSFAEFLEGNISKAYETINKAIDESKKIHSSFLEMQFKNLKGIILYSLGNIDDAILIFKQGIYDCDSKNISSTKLKMYTNLGASYLQNDTIIAKENLEIAFKLFEETQNSISVHRALFYNLIYVYWKLHEKDKMLYILNNYTFKNLDIYYQSLITNCEIEHIGVIQNKNSFFTF